MKPPVAPLALAALLALAPAARAAGEQAEQFTPEFRQVHSTFDAKHSPCSAANGSR